MTQKKWFKDNTISEFKSISEKLGHPPSQKELNELKKSSLVKAIVKYGGMREFRDILGYEQKRVPDGYWSDKIIEEKINVIISDIGHFPTQKELNLLKEQKLLSAINTHGGLNYFRKLMGYELLQKPRGYWKTDENIIKELDLIINKIGHFPVHDEIIKNVGNGLIIAINRRGGINRFRELMGYEPFRAPVGYWTDETICDTLNSIIKEIGHFPSQLKLYNMGRSDLMHGITDHGGINHFRELFGYEPIHKPDGFWNDETIVLELNPIIKEIGHFPNRSDLSCMDRNDLMGAIASHGGWFRFQELCGYNISVYKKELSKKLSYTGKRGKKSEKIVKEIITEWATQNNLPSPQYNVKLSQGNVIEFICSTNKKIGIDVTNTESKCVVSRKWTRKDYYKHLDELWIVVFSDVFTQSDYHKWNQESPSNVKVMSIQQFIDELDYSTDESTKSKIDRYCACTFHTKEEFKTKYIHKPFDNVMVI